MRLGAGPPRDTPPAPTRVVTSSRRRPGGKTARRRRVRCLLGGQWHAAHSRLCRSTPLPHTPRPTAHTPLGQPPTHPEANLPHPAGDRSLSGHAQRRRRRCTPAVHRAVAPRLGARPPHQAPHQGRAAGAARLCLHRAAQRLRVAVGRAHCRPMRGCASREGRLPYPQTCLLGGEPRESHTWKPPPRHEGGGDTPSRQLASAALTGRGPLVCFKKICANDRGGGPAGA